MNDNVKEILTILQEECAEVIVDVSKCFRFGPDQCLENTDISNLEKTTRTVH